jgi:hypothetical protein
MKSFTRFLAALILTAFLLNFTFAAGNPKGNREVSRNTVESLLIGLQSENLGLKTGSAYLLGELKLKEGIIPLMKILREDKNDEARIAAALALYKIGTPMAIHAVKQSIRFDSNERVSRLCANFYNEYLRNKTDDKEAMEDSTNVAVR